MSRRKATPPAWVAEAEDAKAALAAERKLATALRRAHESERNNIALRAEIDALAEQLQLALAVSDLGDARPIKPARRARGQRPAVAVALASDWHVGERVDAHSLDGLNELTPAIAKQRMRDYFVGLDWYVRRQRVGGDAELGYAIDTLVLALLGDMVGGYIHRELAETNYLSPLDEIDLAYHGIVAGIDHLLATSGLARIEVLCVGGNHDRITDKVQHANFAAMSLATMLYRQLARHFAADPRVHFVIATGAMLYSEILDTRFRWFHGHTIRGGGGIGGIMVPFRRWHMTQGATRDVDCSCIGHFHQLIDAGFGIINGSLKGFDSYAANLGFPYERPQQAAFLVDDRHGRREVTPITVGDDMRRARRLAK